MAGRRLVVRGPPHQFVEAVPLKAALTGRDPYTVPVASSAGPDRNPLEGDLVRALASAQAGQMAANAALFQAGEVMAKLVLVGLERWCEVAEDPRSPSQLGARKLIDLYVKTHDRARAVAAGIKLPGGPSAGPNGTT